MTKQMWSTPRAAIYGAIFGVFLILIHLNEHIREFQFSGAIFEMVDTIVQIATISSIYAGMAAIRNVCARRHNKRVAST